MLPDRDIELAHAEAFDFAFGNLPSARRAEFNRHLAGCGYCQAVVDEYSEIGQIIKHLPPHVEPAAELEDRTVAAMVAALAEQRAAGHRPDAEDEDATRAYPIPGRQPVQEPETRVQPIPQFQPPAENETALRQSPAGPPAPAGPQAPPAVTRLPVWRRSRGRLAAIVAVAAAIITAAIVIPLSLPGSGGATVIPLYATAAAKVSGVGAATGQATARQDASGSWDITLTVQHLKDFGDAKWYECWYIGSKPGQRQVAPVGSFLVSDSRSQTFTMTSAVDPREFKTMVITLQLPSADGAFNQGKVILQGQSVVARLHARSSLAVRKPLNRANRSAPWSRK
jgi:hypothetical protein